MGADLHSADLFSLIERGLSVRLGWAEVTTEAVAADAETAKLLAIRPGAPLLLLHRLTFLEDGTPFDLESVRYRGDRCCLTTRIPRPRIQHTHPTERKMWVIRRNLSSFPSTISAWASLGASAAGSCAAPTP